MIADGRDLYLYDSQYGKEPSAQGVALARLAWADRDAPVGQADIWHDGGTADYGEIFEGSGAGFLDWVWPVHETFEVTSHQVTNILVRVDGDRATSETYVTVCLRNAETDIVNRGRYSDTWSRRDGRWAVEHRTYTDDIPQTFPRGQQ